jgi:hypothetical protein
MAFNVDFTNAARKIPEFLNKGGNQSIAYKSGCPFFQNYQREFLLMPVGLSADVVGVMVIAPMPNYEKNQQFANRKFRNYNFSDRNFSLKNEFSFSFADEERYGSNEGFG